MMTQENLLARFSILQQLGRDATGAVYSARDRTTGELVALKRLDPATGAAPSPRLRHPNIVRILDAGEAGGTAFVIMEMLEGESLRKLLDKGPLPVARAIRIAHDIASGLAHAHLQGVVHGGLAASNVIVTRAGVAKIADFSAGQATPDHRSDVLALGALFYEMLAHRAPVADKPPPPSELNHNVPHALDGLVLSMLAAQPENRMVGIPVLLKELDRLEEGLGLAAEAASKEDPKASAPPERPEPALRPIDHEAFARQREMMERDSRRARPSRSRAILPALAVVLAVAGIGYGGFLYYSSLPKENPAAAGTTAPAPVAEASKEPAAAFTPWKPASARAPERPVEKAPAVAPGTPITPPPVAEALTKTTAEPTETAPGTLLGLNAPKPIAPMPQPEPVAKAEPVAKPEPVAKAEPAAKAPAQKPAGRAQLVLAVSPEGELYIDGQRQGSTPPTTTFELEPGMHRIEVRSGSRRPFLTYMTVQAGEVRRIQHDFNAKPSAPPS